jgi:hypothetical protein
VCQIGALTRPPFCRVHRARCRQADTDIDQQWPSSTVLATGRTVFATAARRTVTLTLARAATARLRSVRRLKCTLTLRLVPARGATREVQLERALRPMIMWPMSTLPSVACGTSWLRGRDLKRDVTCRVVLDLVLMHVWPAILVAAPSAGNWSGASDVLAESGMCLRGLRTRNGDRDRVRQRCPATSAGFAGGLRRRSHARVRHRGRGRDSR